MRYFQRCAVCPVVKSIEEVKGEREGWVWAGGVVKIRLFPPTGIPPPLSLSLLISYTTPSSLAQLVASCRVPSDEPEPECDVLGRSVVAVAIFG